MLSLMQCLKFPVSVKSSFVQQLRSNIPLYSRIYGQCRNFSDENDNMARAGYGVFKEKESDDISILVNNFTSPALAKALRDREETLHVCAQLSASKNYDQLSTILHPYLKSNLEKNRRKKRLLFSSGPITRNELVILQRFLHRIPRQVFQPVEKRASVVIPLCNDNGVASILFERRSSTVRTYKHQVCFPGGMVDEGVDSTIIQTSLREMYEELGVPPASIDVLGILRCDWSEVASMTGIAVTPVVGFIGEINDLVITPNPDEVKSVTSRIDVDCCAHGMTFHNTFFLRSCQHCGVHALNLYFPLLIHTFPS